jgi:putative ATPase
MGRNALAAQPDKAKLLHQWLDLLQPQGQLVLAETIPQQTQRLYQYLNIDILGSKLYKRLVKSEEAIYADPDNTLVNWTLDDLEKILQPYQVKLYSEPMQTELTITPTVLDRWFSPGKERPSYGDHLAAKLTASELKTVQESFSRLNNQVVQWQTVIGYIQVRNSG